jgi:hypothetical protein
MKFDFTLYKQEFSLKDSEYAKNKNLLYTLIYKKGRKAIFIFPEYPEKKEHLAIIFANKNNADKYIFDLTDVKYNELVFALLSEYNFWNFKLQQIEFYNKIQKTIIYYYQEQKNYKDMYQEPYNNSLIYAITHVETFFKPRFIRSLIIDTDILSQRIEKSIQQFNKVGVLEPTEIIHIYLMRNKKTNLFKIGFSKNPKKRKNTFRTADPNIEIHRQWFTSQKYESILKNKYKAKRVSGEWFLLDENDIKSIDKLMRSFSPTWADGLAKSIIKMIDNWDKKGPNR